MKPNDIDITEWIAATLNPIASADGVPGSIDYIKRYLHIEFGAVMKAVG